MCKRIFKEETTVEGDIPFYKIGTFGREPDSFISRELFEDYKSRFSYPEAGAILLSASGTIGRIVEYKGEEAYFQDSNIVWLSHDKSVSNKFLKVLYPTVKWDGIEGSTIQRLYNDNFLKTRFMMPSLPEQEKLGEFFEGVDNLITLHQCKYNHIKTSTITFNFNPFTSLNPATWEQRKLGELYTERNEKGNDTLQILSVSIHTGISEGELDSEGLGKNVRRSEDKTKYKHVYSGDLVFNMMRAWQGAIGVAKNEGMISPAYISAIPNKEVFPLFMDYSLRRKEAISQINDLSYGVTDFRKRLYWGSFAQVNCALPSVEEQRKIWAFLNDIDNAITLHQRKCFITL